MKRVFCIALTIFFLLSTVAMAEITPYSNEIREASCNLTRDGNALTAIAIVRSREQADVLKITSLSIQEYQDGRWVTVKSVSNVIKTNSSYLSKTLTHTGKTDCKYRAVARFSVTIDGVTATATRTSATR